MGALGEIGKSFSAVWNAGSASTSPTLTGKAHDALGNTTEAMANETLRLSSKAIGGIMGFTLGKIRSLLGSVASAGGKALLRAPFMPLPKRG